MALVVPESGHAYVKKALRSENVQGRLTFRQQGSQVKTRNTW